MAIKLPHMPLWVYDLEADEDCSLMSLAEYGAFLRLLQRQWIEGTIPACEKRLARLLRVSQDEFAEIWEMIRHKFTEDQEGRLINARLESERSKALEKVEKNRAAANKRWGNADGDADASSDANANENADGMLRAYGSGSGSGSGSSEEKKVEKEKWNDSKFEEWWSAWPSHKRKQAKDNCRAKWRNNGCDEHFDLIMSSLESWKSSHDWTKENGDFIPTPHKWLREKIYEAPVNSLKRSKEKTKNGWEKLSQAQKLLLLEEVRSDDPSTYHSPGVIDTDRAMIRLAKKKGLIQ